MQGFVLTLDLLNVIPTCCYTVFVPFEHALHVIQYIIIIITCAARLMLGARAGMTILMWKMCSRPYLQHIIDATMFFGRSKESARRGDPASHGSRVGLKLHEQDSWAANGQL